MSRRIGVHSGYFRGSRLENDIFEIVRVIHRAGGNAVEFMPGQLLSLSAAQRQDFRALLVALDMELIVGAGRSPATDPSSPDPAIRRAALDFSRQVLELLSKLGCHKWDGLIHACWPGRPQGVLSFADKAAALERSAAAMRQMMPLADDADVNLCFEVVNRFEHYLLNTAEEALAFCEMIDHPRAKVLLDVFHMNIEEDDIGAAILAASTAGRLGHFHVGEANRSVPGTVASHLDWPGIFAALRKAGYSGSIVLEPFVLGGEAYSTNVSLWRDLTHGASFEQYLDNLAIGINFIRGLWS